MNDHIIYTGVVPIKPPIDKCNDCPRYNKELGRQRNKLRCMVGCKPYIEYQEMKAIEYNRAVSGEDFDTEEIYEHGNKVLGSGLRKGD